MKPIRVLFLALVATGLFACGGDDGLDSCPDNPDKTEPGVCGCQVLDTDTDHDGTEDCVDRCKDDPEKTSLGLCGCGVADGDRDGDSRPDCFDGCPDDRAKVIPGECGCGESEGDYDADGTPDCTDGCPADPAKIEPGACGCGYTDGDDDTDGHLDCADNCPAASNPDQANADGDELGDVCDDDDDNDEVLDAEDNCPLVANPGQENADLDSAGDACDDDSDNDGIPDDADNCPLIANATQTDGDGDGAGDPCDGCPVDPAKTEPGFCGCGLVEDATDDDGDLVPNCGDNCVDVPNPLTDDTVEIVAPVVTNPFGHSGHVCDDGGSCWSAACDVSTNGSAPEHGICQALGYEQAISVTWGYGPGDSDNPMPHAYNWSCIDFVCVAGSTYDSDNCSSSEMLDSITCHTYGQPDADDDGAGDACDDCPSDPDKLEPGLCGCGSPDVDTDSDGLLDCDDGCPTDPAKSVPGVCGCGAPDVDSDADGTYDCHDDCPADPAKTAPGQCGCGTADTDADADGVADCLDNCDAVPNPDQADWEGDGVGDVCDPDDDDDGTADATDNCPLVANDQTDADGDGAGDACDECPADPLKLEPGVCGCGTRETDDDADSVTDCLDNCPGVYNPEADVTVTLAAPIVTNPFGVTGHVCDDGSSCSVSSCDVSANGSAPEHGICQALGHDRAVSVVWGYGPGESDTSMPHAYNWTCSAYVCSGGSTYSSDNCSSTEMLSSITCRTQGQPDADGDGLGDACDP